MSEATAGVAHANASARTSPKLSPPSAGVTETFARSSSWVRTSFVHDAEHVDSCFVEAEPRVQQPVLQRVGADEPEARAGLAWIRGQARSSVGRPLRGSWRPMNTTGGRGSSGRLRRE